MKKVFAAIAVVSMLLFGCAGDGTTTVGDGKIDAVQAATIQVAIGVVLNAKPEVVPIAYAVSTELLFFIDSDSVTNVSVVDEYLNGKIVKLNLDAGTRQSFIELVALVKAEISKRISTSEFSGKEIVVVTEFLKIVQSAAHQRMVLK